MQLFARLRTRSCLVALAFLVLTALLARPAEARWESIGPYGGSVTALAVASSNRRTLYAGTIDGLIFRSGDAGATWTNVSGPFPAVSVTDIEVDPSNPATAYAVVCYVSVEFSYREGGVFKTLDGGRTWDLVNHGDIECDILDLAIDPRNPSHIFAATSVGLFQSDDGAASWRLSSGLAGERGAGSVVFDPATPGTLYALQFDAGFIKSVDGGATWVARNAGLPEQRWRLVEIAASPGALLVGAFEASAPLFRSTDGGESWSPTGTALGALRVHDLAFAPAGSTAYVSTDGGVFRSADRGLTWTAPAAGEAKPSWTLAVPPSPAGVVYAGRQYEGVFKSSDAGASWRSANRGLTGIPVEEVAIAPSDPSFLYARTTDARILRSPDGGATWLLPGLGIEGIPFVMAVHPQDPRTVFAAGFQGGLWKTTNAGATWRRVGDPEMACMAATDLAIDPRNPSNVYVAGPFTSCPQWPDICLGFKSTDSGETWSCMEGLPEQEILSIALAPSLPTTLYASTEAFNVRPVFKSIDAGRTWRPRSGGLPPRSVYSLAVSPRDPRTVYASSREGLYKSVNGAATWVPAHNGMPAGVILGEPAIATSNPSLLFITASFPDPTSPTGEFASLLFRSTNAAASWSPLTREGLPAGFLRSLRISSTQPRTLYVATRFGIYRLPLAGQR